MRTLLERHRALALAAICPCIAATLGPDLSAEVFGPPDPPPPLSETILFVGNLNFDCFPDTVVADTR